LESDLGFEFSAQDIDHTENSEEEVVWAKRNLKYFIHLALLPQQPDVLTYKTYEEIELDSVHLNELESEAAGYNQPSVSSSIRHGDLQVCNNLEPCELHRLTLNIQGSILGCTPGLSETDNANELVAFLEPEAGMTEQTYGEIDVGARLISTSPTSPELGLSSLRSISGSTFSLRESNDKRGLIVSYSGQNAILNTNDIEANREFHTSNSNMNLLFTTLEFPGRPDGALGTRAVEVIDSCKLNQCGTFLPLDTEFSSHLDVEAALPYDEDLDGDTLNSNAGTIFANIDFSAQLPAALRYLGEVIESRDDFKNAPELIVEASGCCARISSIIIEDPKLTSEPYLSHSETHPLEVNVEQSTTEYQQLRSAYECHIITSDLHDRLLTTRTDRHTPSAIDVLDAGLRMHRMSEKPCYLRWCH
jgi:hypothetical protein